VESRDWMRIVWASAVGITDVIGPITKVNHLYLNRKI